VCISMLGISALAFALGMYLPIELNSPILLGAIVGWLVQKSTKDEKLSKARNDKSILIASGFIAGGALAGVFDGITKMFVPETGFGFSSWMPTLFTPERQNWLGLIVFVALSCFLYWDARKAKVDA
jgi:hypothetical protein